MRPFPFVCLLVPVLLGVGIYAHSADAPPRSRGFVLTPQPAADAKPFAAVVEGTGKSIQDAHDIALDKAHRAVADFLRDQDPPFAWTPTPAYVEQYLVKSNPATDRTQEIDDLGKTYTRRLKVEIDGRQFRAMLNLDRHERMEHRHLLAAKVLGVLVVLCAAVAGYIRLDELTKGYLTNWLRAIGVGAVLAAAAALWYWM
jgi:hypothetical protein